MLYSLSLSVGEVHFTLTPASQSPSSSSLPSCTSYDSPVISIKHRRRLKERNHPSNECVAGAATYESDHSDGAHDGDNNDDSGEGFNDDDGELIADLSNFSGTLCISKDNKIGTRKSVVLKKRETGPPIANAADEHRSNNHCRVAQNKRTGANKNLSSHELEMSLKESKSSFTSLNGNSVNSLQRITESIPLEEAKNNGDYVDDLKLQQDEDLTTEVSLPHHIDRRNAALLTFRDSSSVNLGTTTPLHAACASNKSNILTLRSILQSNPSFASKRDSFGRLPIHIFSQNEVLANTLFRGTAVGPDGIRTGNESAELFLGELFDAAPRSVIVPGIEDANIPFVSAIVEWTKLVHSNAHREVTALTISRTRTSGMNLSHVFASYSMDEQRRIFFFPKGVNATTFVAWSLQMLSFLLDKCHKKRDLDLYMSIRDSIIEEVSSIPLFCKTVLLIESNSEFQKIRSLSIVKSSFFNKNAVGAWMVAMFKGPRLAQNRVVDFLQLVSNVTIDDMIGAHFGSDDLWQCSQSDVDYFMRNRKETFDAVANLTSIIPALRVLPSKGLERAATTSVVHYLLNKRIRSPWTLISMLFDCQMSLILIASFKLASEFASRMDDLSQYGNASDPFILVYITSFYFIQRELVTIISVSFLSKKLVLHYFRDVWILADLVALAMVLPTTIALHDIGREFEATGVLAATTALLWVKIIGFLRAVNMELATFIMAIAQILKDMKWFALLLAIAIILFSEMVEIIIKYTPGICSDPSDETEENFCSPYPLDSYVRIYSIVVGDVSLDDFTQTALITSMFVLFTFFGVIVLLTILVAIVNDSYAKSMLRSYGLFGRARIEYVVRQLAREIFTAPKMSISEDGTFVLRPIMILKSLLASFGFLMVLCIKGAVGYYLVSICVTLNALTSKIDVTFYFVCFILLAILYASSMVAVVASALGALFLDTSWLTETRGKSTLHLMFDLLRLPILILCMVLGIENHEKEIRNVELAASNEWSGQLNFVGERTQEIVNFSEERLKVEVKDQVKSSEQRQMNHVEGLKNELRNELRALMFKNDS